jgi:phospholipid N-methyltransferase
MKKTITVDTPFGVEVIGKEGVDVCDELTRVTALLMKHSQTSSKLMSGLLEYLNSDMSEDDKMRLYNPKQYYLNKKQEKPIIIMTDLSKQAIETLKNSEVKNLVVKLPEGKLDRKIYVEVKTRLELIGGKWVGGKVAGFVFEQDPTELLEQISSGEKRNLKKEFQFFGTSDKLADDLVFEAQIEPYHKILEPSAGRGAIIKAIRRLFSDVEVDYCEFMELNRKYLTDIKNTKYLCDDFLKLKSNPIYDRVIANPPFSKNQDIDHILKMYSMLKVGGTLVSIASCHWKHSKNKKETEFRDWLKEVKADTRDIEKGAFKESGTNIETVMIIITKK